MTSNRGSNINILVTFYFVIKMALFKPLSNKLGFAIVDTYPCLIFTSKDHPVS